MDNTQIYKNLISDIEPDIELYKIGPEVITEFLGKFIVLLGGAPADIKSVTITDDKKKLRIFISVEKESMLFQGKPAPASHLSMLGTGPVSGGELSEHALNVMSDLGFRYKSLEKRREIALYSIEKNKKSYEIELDSEIVMAIITDSNYLDEHLFVDATEEVVHRKDYDKKKFKGKKSLITFAKVQRSCNAGGYNPVQVYERNNGLFKSEDDSDEE